MPGSAGSPSAAFTYSALCVPTKAPLARICALGWRHTEDRPCRRQLWYRRCLRLPHWGAHWPPPRRHPQRRERRLRPLLSRRLRRHPRLPRASTSGTPPVITGARASYRIAASATNGAHSRPRIRRATSTPRPAAASASCRTPGRLLARSVPPPLNAGRDAQRKPQTSSPRRHHPRPTRARAQTHTTNVIPAEAGTQVTVPQRLACCSVRSHTRHAAASCCLVDRGIGFPPSWE